MRLDRRILGLIAAAILAVVALSAASPAFAHAGHDHGQRMRHGDGGRRAEATHVAAEAGPRRAPDMRAVRLLQVHPILLQVHHIAIAIGLDLPAIEPDVGGAGCCPDGCRKACCGTACAAAGLVPQGCPALPPPRVGALRPCRAVAARPDATPEALPEPPRRGA